MLELFRIPRVYRSSRAIHVQLPDQATATVHADKLLAVRPLFRAFAQSQKTDKDVRFRIFVRKECLPSAIRSVISPEKLDVLGSNPVMYLVYLQIDGPVRHTCEHPETRILTHPDFAIAHISTLRTKVLHPS